MGVSVLRALVVLAALTMAACAPKVGVQRIDPAERPPNTGRLDVYENPAEVGRAFNKIAVLDVTSQKRVREGRGGYQEPLLAKARELGADALVIVDRRARTQRNSDGMGGYIEFTVEQVIAEAIVYE